MNISLAPRYQTPTIRAIPGMQDLGPVPPTPMAARVDGNRTLPGLVAEQ
jgi:hypothetical protein